MVHLKLSLVFVEHTLVVPFDLDKLFVLQDIEYYFDVKNKQECKKLIHIFNILLNSVWGNTDSHYEIKTFDNDEYLYYEWKEVYC